MGNQQTKVGLRLDRDQYEAGGVITGRVYLSLSKQQPQSTSNNHAISGLHLRFTGEEYAQVARKQKHHNKNHQHHQEPVIERSTHVLVRNDFPLVDLRGTNAGQYEYPFELPVPPDLPSSMRCAKDKSNKSYCEIRFKLMAYLVGGYSTGDVSAETAVRLLSRGNTNAQYPQPLLVESEAYPINVCCFWNKGHIKLGWQTDRSTVAPGDAIQIEAFGENNSKLEVEALTVKWVETTTWKTSSSDGHRRSVQRTVAQQKIDVNRLSQWAPRDVMEHGLVQNDNFQDQRPVHFSLHLPHETRETYTGSAVLVRHMIIVRANTAGGFTTTSPESSCQVKVHRLPNTPDASPSDPVMATATIVNLPPESSQGYFPTTDNTQNIVHAQALPSDWNPVQADVVVIPVAAAVVIDEDTTPEATSYLTTAPREEDLIYPSHSSSPAMTAPTYQATAPNESLLDATVTAPTSSTSGPVNQSDTTQQLRTFIADSPENLNVLLVDPAWVDIVQRLDPREFCSLVSAAPPKVAGSVARTLALTMASNFTCRYVVACLWSLSDDTRMGVVCSVASLPTDLQANQSIIEQELRGHELDQFRQSILG